MTKCNNVGPRIKDQAPRCELERGHEGPHVPHESWLDVIQDWSDIRPTPTPTPTPTPSQAGAEEFTEENDRIPDDVLPKLLALYERMPQGWEVRSSQASQKSVTATVAFDGIADPWAQHQALEDMFSAAGYFGTLVRNLQRERGV